MTRNVTKTTLCSTLAIATAMLMGPRPAMAQAFIGTVTSSTSVSAPVNGAGTTFINVTAPQAVINWDATGIASSGVVTFQGSGTTATFSSSGAGFAVLNRVNANGNAIKLDGTINSYTGNGVGGTVYFSSADGIIIGSNAAINVGSLGLTTLPILDVLGNWMTGFGTTSPQVTFGAAVNPFASITTESGSQLNANGASNYVALIAPKITHSGTILTDGGAALVGANAATITFSNSNLYTIQVDAPSGAFRAVTVDGGKIKANDVGLAADRHAYLVTMAPNDTNTILITGGADLGFATATTASSVGNAVVLSAGGNVYGGTPSWDVNYFGDATIDGASITSNFTALGKNGVTVSNATGATIFSDDVHLFTHGGDINIVATNGDLSIGGTLYANASFSASDGQSATANTINLLADGSNASITVFGDAFLAADGYGGYGNADFPNGGNGTGGTIGVVATNNATVDLRGNLTASATGRGRSPQYGSGGLAGSGTGGSITLAADVGATSGVIVRGLSSLRANGYGGGSSDGDPVTGGLGTGGTVAVRATGSAGNFVQADASLLAEASGIGGSGDLAGGNGIGGTVTVSNQNGASVVLNNPQLNAVGQGGSSFTGAGGSGLGGNATLRVSAGSVALTGNLSINTSAVGGFSNSGAGGSATGGASRIFLFSPSANLNIAGTTTLDARATSGYSLSNNGGTATGGFAGIEGQGGTGHFGGDTTLSANATAGGSTTGDGGNATGGIALTRLFSTALTFDAALSTHADATGGYGVNGGNAIGAIDNGNFISGLIVRGASSVTVAGGTTLTATTTGGTAHDYGHGGNAVGSVTIHDINGDVIGGGLTGIFVKGNATAAASVTLTGLIVDTSAVGGNGGFGTIGLNGGNGGSATGGEIGVVARSSDIGTNLLSADNMSLTANAVGGNGGLGGDGPSGLAGGAGGDATSGMVSVLGGAGNGRVVANTLTISQIAAGGDGGRGGTADSPLGSTGNGGNGGNATAPRSSIGVVSNDPIFITNYGSAWFGNVTVFTSAHGGTGGNAGSGSPTLGSAGNGGSAWGGNSTLYSRGADVQVGSMTVDARAFGGNGGFSNIGGVGGNAHAGSIIALSTTRYLHPEQAGSLIVVGAFSGDASAYRGSGLTNGTATIDPSINTGVGVEVLGGSTAQFGSFSLAQFAANGTVSGAGPSFLHVVNGTLNVTNGLSIVTDGVLQVLVDSGSVTAGNVNLYAGDFTHSAGAPPTLVGTITADQFNIGSANNIIIDANLNSTGIDNSLFLNASGLVSAYNLTSVNDINVTAGGFVVTGNIDGGFVHLQASDSVTTGDINSGSNIQVTSGADMILGNLVAGVTSDINSNKAIRIDTGGSVLVGNILAAGGIDITATDTVTGGNVTTGDGVFTDAGGAIHYGNISAGLVNPQPPSGPFSVGMSSGTSITVGNVVASLAVGFLSPGTLTTGDITTASDLLTLVHGDISIGDISADGRVYLADFSMFTNAGGVLGADNNIDPEVIFAATPVATGGSIAVGGVLAGSFQAAGASISAGDINANSFIQMISTGAINFNSLTAGSSVNLNAGGAIDPTDINAGTSIDIIGGGAITLGNLTAGTYIDILGGGNLTTGNVLAVQKIRLVSGGAISTAAMTAGGAVQAKAAGNIVTGDLSAGLVNTWLANPEAYVVELNGGGSVTTGNIASAEHVALAAGGALSTGTIDAGGIVLALVTGDMDFGAITTSAAGQVYLADYSMFALGITGPDNFDPNLVFAYQPFATGGSININGPVSTGQFDASAGTDFSAGNISSGSRIAIWAGGDITVADLVADLSSNPDEPAIRLNAGGSVLLGDAIAAGRIKLNAGGTVTGGGITTGLHLSAEANGAINLGAISAGLINPQGPANQQGFSVGISSGTSISVGNVVGAEAIGFATLGPLTTGNLNAGTDVLAMAGGNMSFGAITAGASGRTYLADSSMFIAAGGTDNFNPALVFAATPVASGGSILINGPVSTGSFQAAGASISAGNINANSFIQMISTGAINFNSLTAGSSVNLNAGGAIDPTDIIAGTSIDIIGLGAITLGNLTAGTYIDILGGGNLLLGNATAGEYIALQTTGGTLTGGNMTAGNSIHVTATGLASVNGRWQGGPVTIVANDLAIGADGSVKGGAVRIESTNANGMFLGDGLTGSGFMLSQAEASRIAGTTLAFDSAGGSSPQMTIGNLTLDATGMSGSELMQFAAPGGTIRIVGDLAINGIADPAFAIGFYAPLFMLDEATGSLALTNGTQLGGTLNIYAHDVWVADGAILARLLADPNYAGRDAELAVAPTGVSGPVISANVINVTFENGGPRTVTPYTLLVQNTGDATTRQGFLATDANATLGEGAAGLIDMVINGQGQTEGGLISGVAVRDALMQGDDPTRFTATSTINGCSVAGGSCGTPPIPDPGVVIADEIVLFSIGADDKPLFGNEQQIVNNYDDILDPGTGAGASDVVDQLAADEEQRQKEEDEADAASSPIEPPNPLFDSRPLNTKDSTDEPISGGGNPALIGSDINPTTGGQ